MSANADILRVEYAAGRISQAAYRAAISYRRRLADPAQRQHDRGPQ
jgi:hypothetical protein